MSRPSVYIYIGRGNNDWKQENYVQDLLQGNEKRCSKQTHEAAFQEK